MLCGKPSYVGAALARGLATRALSYTKYGFLRSANQATVFSACNKQDLHMLGGRSKVDMQSLVDGLLLLCLEFFFVLFVLAFLFPDFNKLLQFKTRG